MTAVSVIVPTRNRPSALVNCLAALASQRGVDGLEIIVVDDASTDGDAVAGAVRRHAAARRVQGAGVGPAAARNAGVHAARGEFLCFTDDDCVPEPDWAARLVAALERGADVAGGTTINGRNGDPWVGASELIVRVLQESTQQRLAPVGRVFIPSNNLACRRTLVLAHPFDEAYRRAGGEDRAWCASVAAAGHRLVLEPSAVMAHYPTLGLKGFWRQHVRYGRGAFRFSRQHGAEWGEPPRFYWTLLRAGAAEGVMSLMLVGIAQVATMTGYALEAMGPETQVH